MTISVEQQRVKHCFEHVEEIEEVADTFEPEDERRGRLLGTADRMLAGCEPVRISIAADLLDLTEPTVRAWARKGVLVAVECRSPSLHLDPRRLHEVMHLVRDLRTAGSTRGLLEAVWHRLSDRVLLERPDLTESIEQMRRGEGREIGPDELTS